MTHRIIISMDGCSNLGFCTYCFRCACIYIYIQVFVYVYMYIIYNYILYIPEEEMEKEKRAKGRRCIIDNYYCGPIFPIWVGLYSSFFNLWPTITKSNYLGVKRRINYRTPNNARTHPYERVYLVVQEQQPSHLLSCKLYLTCTSNVLSTLCSVLMCVYLLCSSCKNMALCNLLYIH